MLQSADELIPARNYQAAVLLAGKSSRLINAQPRGIPSRKIRIARISAVAACLMIASSTLFHNATGVSPTIAEDGLGSINTSAMHTAGFSLEALTQRSAEEELLGTAFRSSAWQPNSPWERSQWRAVSTHDSEIEDALEALKKNPALVRAGVVVSTNRERKSDTLRALYANRNL